MAQAPIPLPGEQTLDKSLLPVGVVVSIVIGFVGLTFTGATRAEKMEARTEAVDAAQKITAAEVKEHVKDLVAHDRRIQRVEDAQVTMLDVLKEIRADQKDLKSAVEDLRKKR